MTINTGTFKSMRELNTMYEPVLRGAYTQSVEQQIDYLPMMYNMGKTTKEREHYEGVGAQGLMQPWGSTGKAVYYEDREKLFPTSIPQIKYSLGTQIDREWFDFNKHQDIKDEVIKLSDAVYQTRQYQGIETFKNAFTTSGTDYRGVTIIGGSGGPDGKALCATDHPLSPSNSSQTNSNKVSTSLDYDSWHDVQVMGQNWVDSKGNLMPVTFDCLMVSPRLMSIAYQLAGMNANKADNASALYVPEQANFSLNIYRGTFDVIVNPYLPNAYNWFAINKSRMRRYNKWNEFRKPDFKNETDFDTEIFKYAVVGLWGKGFIDWSWIIGSDATS